MKVIAVYAVNNWGGIEVAEMNEETVTWRWNFGEPEEWQTESSHGGEWFWAEGEKIFTTELCRVA